MCRECPRIQFPRANPRVVQPEHSMNTAESWRDETRGRRSKRSSWCWENTRETKEMTPAWGTAAGKALEMSRLRSPLLHLNETLKTERQRYFDKRLDRWVGNNRCRTPLSAPVDLYGARTATRTRFAARSCFVPRRNSRRYYSHAKHRGEVHPEKLEATM